jgi:hypothetical protein
LLARQSLKHKFCERQFVDLFDYVNACASGISRFWTDSARASAALKLKSPKGKMQSPLQTSVQVLRNTRLVEEVCAWAVAITLFRLKIVMRGSALNQRR